MRRYLSQVVADAAFYHRLKRPQQRLTIFSLMMVAWRSPGLRVLASHRIIHHSVTQRNLRKVSWWLVRLAATAAQYLNNVLCKSDLLGDCQITGPVYLPDGGYLTCGARSIGAGSLVHDHVTFGHGVGGGNTGRPRVGAQVWIGPNCIITGEIEVGEGATLLPGTYVSQSVPARAVVRGNPGRIIRTGFDNTALRTSLAVVDRLPDAVG